MADRIDPVKLVINFAKDNPNVPALKFILEDQEGIHVKLIDGHGIINYVYRVESADRKSTVIIKYAEVEARCIPGEMISLERQDLEYNCLKLMNSLEQGSAPEPYCLDKKHNVLAMQDMRDWELLGSQLEKWEVHIDAATDLGRLLGKVHFETSEANVTKEKWEELKTTCHTQDMKDYNLLFTIIRPFNAEDPLNKIAKCNSKKHHQYSQEAEKLQLLSKLTELYNEEVCFVHGDCHYKSIFVKDGHVALFDFEFGFLAHPAYNVGFIVGCYIAAVIYSERHPKPALVISKEEMKSNCIQAISNMLEAYLSAEKDVSKSKESRRDFLSALALFTGSILFTVGTFAQIELLLPDISDEDRASSMDAGFILMKASDQIDNIGQFITLISQPF